MASYPLLGPGNPSTTYCVFQRASSWNWHASAPGAHVDIDGARNYARDEGRPLGAGLQEQASNHLKLHRSRAVVVSVKEKSGQRILAGKDQGDEHKRTSD